MRYVDSTFVEYIYFCLVYKALLNLIIIHSKAMVSNDEVNKSLKVVIVIIIIIMTIILILIMIIIITPKTTNREKKLKMHMQSRV
jgi:hypothetical protein